MVSPEPMGMARTKIRWPPAVLAFDWLKDSVTSLIHCSFSDPYGKTNSREPLGASEVAAGFSEDCGLGDERQPETRAKVRRRSPGQNRADPASFVERHEGNMLKLNSTGRQEAFDDS